MKMPKKLMNGLLGELDVIGGQVLFCVGKQQVIDVSTKA